MADRGWDDGLVAIVPTRAPAARHTDQGVKRCHGRWRRQPVSKNTVLLAHQPTHKPWPTVTAAQ